MSEQKIISGYSTTTFAISIATRCPLWSLRVPELGKKSCKEKTRGGVPVSICSMECEEKIDAFFVVQPHDEYTCTERGQWNPSGFVPDCVPEGNVNP